MSTVSRRRKSPRTIKKEEGADKDRLFKKEEDECEDDKFNTPAKKSKSRARKDDEDEAEVRKSSKRMSKSQANKPKTTAEKSKAVTGKTKSPASAKKKPAKDVTKSKNEKKEKKETPKKQKVGSGGVTTKRGRPRKCTVAEEDPTPKKKGKRKQSESPPLIGRQAKKCKQLEEVEVDDLLPGQDHSNLAKSFVSPIFANPSAPLKGAYAKLSEAQHSFKVIGSCETRLTHLLTKLQIELDATQQKLDAEEIRKKEATRKLGNATKFVFDLELAEPSSWNTKLKELREFVEDNDGKLPRHHTACTSDIERRLTRWVHTIKGHMTKKSPHIVNAPHRVKVFEELGVQWSAGLDGRFQKMFERLKFYGEEQGTFKMLSLHQCKIAGNAELIELRKWVHSQVLGFRYGILGRKQHQIQALRSIGFSFEKYYGGQGGRKLDQFDEMADGNIPGSVNMSTAGSTDMSSSGAEHGVVGGDKAETIANSANGSCSNMIRDLLEQSNVTTPGKLEDEAESGPVADSSATTARQDQDDTGEVSAEMASPTSISGADAASCADMNTNTEFDSTNSDGDVSKTTYVGIDNASTSTAGDSAVDTTIANIHHSDRSVSRRSVNPKEADTEQNDEPLPTVDASETTTSAVAVDPRTVNDNVTAIDFTASSLLPTTDDAPITAVGSSATTSSVGDISIHGAGFANVGLKEDSEQNMEGGRHGNENDV